MVVAELPTLSTFLIKVAARCDLACDYCYVFEHADQSWRDLPARMSPAVQRRTAERIGEYAQENGLTDVTIIFHGGEPLLLGSKRLAAFAAEIEEQLPAGTTGHFGLQTNGLLLDENAVADLAAAGIAVSISLDGPKEANDRHRLTISGRSSFDATSAAIERVRHHRNLFAGVISVIDVQNDPHDLLEFFAAQDLPQLDLLLPDATHDDPPVGRDRDPDVYRRWLLAAFDAWFDDFGAMPLRTFDALVGAVAGLESPTDAFGFGDVSLIAIETDGSYHDLDVLKIAGEGSTAIGASVFTEPIVAAASSEKIAEHRRLLTIEGLSETCQACPEVAVCGGGAVPHRFGEGSFDHPSVYCEEIKALIGQARRRLLEVAAAPDTRRGSISAASLAKFDRASTSGPIVDGLLERWGDQQREILGEAVEAAAALTNRPPLDDDLVARVALRPSAILWARAMNAASRGHPLSNLEGAPLPADPDYVEELRQLAERTPGSWPDVHRNDPWLRISFGAPIVFPERPEDGVPRLLDAFRTISDYSPATASELRLLCPDVQFVRDLSAQGDKVVSFSDDLVPGALYVSDRTQAGPVDRLDLADSVLHEYRHQKLYLMEREVRFVLDDTRRVRSPWREDPRPPSGLLHACFVFVELRDFWIWARETGAAERSRAEFVITEAEERLAAAWAILDTVALTPAGEQLVTVLASRSTS